MPEVMQWFGPPWGDLDESQRAERPDAPCIWCDELFTDQDQGLLLPYIDGGRIPYHRDCFMRTIVGSLGHQQKRCSCFGGYEEDPPEMTRRQGATAAVEYWHAHHEQFLRGRFDDNNGSRDNGSTD